MCLLREMKQSQIEMNEFNQITFRQCKRRSWQYDSSICMTNKECLKNTLCKSPIFPNKLASNS
jgi:hypothetical protein